MRSSHFNLRVCAGRNTSNAKCCKPSSATIFLTVYVVGSSKTRGAMKKALAFASAFFNEIRLRRVKYPADMK